MFDQLQLIHLVKAETVIPTTCLKKSTTIRRLRNAALDQRFSTQITPRPVFYHHLGRGRKAILYGSLLGQFYLPPSNKKGLKCSKYMYLGRYYILFFKISYTSTI